MPSTTFVHAESPSVTRMVCLLVLQLAICYISATARGEGEGSKHYKSESPNLHFFIHYLFLLVGISFIRWYVSLIVFMSVAIV